MFETLQVVIALNCIINLNGRFALAVLAHRSSVAQSYMISERPLVLMVQVE